ncbi:peptidase domain-containing ABC transporter [Luteibacter sp. PPL552]
MKTILQSEPAECGLACIAMMSSAFGHDLTLHEMRRRFPSSLKGVRLSVLMDVAHRLGMRARAIRVELTELRKVKVPCILHWDMNHFVVLSKAKRRNIEIVDPAHGRRWVSWNEASERFTGIALELEAGADFCQKKPEREVSIRSLMGPVRGLRSALTTMLALSLALQICVLIAPFYLQWVVDQALVSADKGLLTVLGLAFGTAAIFQAILTWLRGFAIVQLSASLSAQWVSDVFAHMLRLPLEFFERRHLGDITSRIGSVQTIQGTLTTGFVEALIDGAMAAVTFFLMCFYSLRLALISSVATALYLMVRTLTYWRVRALNERHLLASASQQTHLIETVRGMQSLKVSGKEAYRRVTHDNLVINATNLENSMSRVGLLFTTINQLIFGLERVAVVWLGASFALSNSFSVGMLVAYLAYKEQFSQRIVSLIDKSFDFRMLRLHGSRLADIVLSEPEPMPPAREATFSGTGLAITVQNLSFRYSESEPWILDDCSFSIEAGESVAFVGPSGCGKTTLVKIILGVLKPTRGTIKIGGLDIGGADGMSIRHVIGAVMQEDQLFAGTIAQNIGFFDPEFDMARVEAAAKVAAIHDEIVAMPMGYESLIGDMGSALSGGQKQRIILARALYSAPLVLFLDEATSHLDVEREREVNDAIRALAVTRVIVAHRPETISSADRVLVLERGKIIRSLTPMIPAESARADV